MGTRVTIGTHQFEVIDFTVSEESTPLSAGDTSGSVGTVTLNIAEPDPALYDRYGSGSRLILDYGPSVLVGLPVQLDDTDFGSIPGKVTNISRPSRGSLSIVCTSRLALLNVYNIKAQPHVGTLETLFTYYMSLAGVTTDFEVDSFLASRPIAAIGWNGELWTQLKQLCAAHAAEIALVDGVIILRPNRTVELSAIRDESESQETPVPTLAQSIEVYRYGIYGITDQLVYPPGGWTSDVQVLNVNAGESAEYQLDLSASVSEIQVPTMQESVGLVVTESVFTAVANDGLPVPVDQWYANGGSLTVEINPDTVSLTVKLVGPTGIGTSDGEEATNFSIALASDSSGSYYSTLRIFGSGVAFNKQKKTIRTLVTDAETATDVGVTIDNTFISTNDEMYRAGIRSACEYAGPIQTFTSQSPESVGFEEFGHVAGARVWDRYSRRWYRVRTANMSKGSVGIQRAEDDTTVGDREDYTDWTIGDREDAYDGLTIGQVEVMGLRGG